MVKETVLHRCGIWIAEAADENRECYSPGEIFIKVDKCKLSKVPPFLGKGDIPDKKNLLELIDRVSQKMMDALRCERVYLVSVGESNKDGLHFRLLPRYREDGGFLDDLDPEIGTTNDGLALMAKWRKQFVLKKQNADRKPIDKIRKAHRDATEKVREALQTCPDRSGIKHTSRPINRPRRIS